MLDFIRSLYNVKGNNRAKAPSALSFSHGLMINSSNIEYDWMLPLKWLLKLLGHNYMSYFDTDCCNIHYVISSILELFQVRFFNFFEISQLKWSVLNTDLLQNLKKFDTWSLAKSFNSTERHNLLSTHHKCTLFNLLFRWLKIILLYE